MWKIDLRATQSWSRVHQSGPDDSVRPFFESSRLYIDVKDWFARDPIQIQRTLVPTRWFRWSLFFENLRLCTMWKIELRATQSRSRVHQSGPDDSGEAFFWIVEVVYRCERLICARPYPDLEDTSPDQMIQARPFLRIWGCVRCERLIARLKVRESELELFYRYIKTFSYGD
jgi:hypothetical protein